MANNNTTGPHKDSTGPRDGRGKGKGRGRGKGLGTGTGGNRNNC